MGVFDSIFGGGGGNVQMPKPEEYLPLVLAQANLNRLDQTSPFGGIRYVQDETPQTWEEWSAANPGTQKWVGRNYDDNQGWYGGNLIDTGPKRSDYDKYVQQWEIDNPGRVEHWIAPELESVFTNIFTPDAYDQYGDDYMADFTSRFDPVYDRRLERTEQTLANRGIPVGSSLFSDTMDDFLSAQDDVYSQAAFTAKQLGEQARIQDFNRLITAMGGNAVPYQPIDTMGPANMALNANIANAQNQANASNAFWSTVPQLALTAYGGSQGWWS